MLHVQAWQPALHTAARGAANRPVVPHSSTVRPPESFAHPQTDQYCTSFDCSNQLLASSTCTPSALRIKQPTIPLRTDEEAAAPTTTPVMVSCSPNFCTAQMHARLSPVGRRLNCFQSWMPLEAHSRPHRHWTSCPAGVRPSAARTPASVAACLVLAGAADSAAAQAEGLSLGVSVWGAQRCLLKGLWAATPRCPMHLAKREQV